MRRMITHYQRPVPGTKRTQWVAAIKIGDVEFTSPPTTADAAARIGQLVEDTLEEHGQAPSLPPPPPAYQRIKIRRVGGYDPTLGPGHPANRDSSLEDTLVEAPAPCS